jgi:hypothetical protein
VQVQPGRCRYHASADAARTLFSNDAGYPAAGTSILVMAAAIATAPSSAGDGAINLILSKC